MVYFLYFLVHVLKLFDNILYIFPVRGHFCLPNDQDFSLTEKKKRRMERVEVPEEWDKLIFKAREKPSFFEVVNLTQESFFNIKKYFLKLAKPSIKIKSIEQLQIEAGVPTISVKRLLQRLLEKQYHPK
ncbi:hypothetical protein ILUMI_01627 [Ignelater luminosus]|uniref:Uncharacterized protein n=1 Tax=Ignelater luminosus TaxID=2038154 RepID=A0A8K0DE17_IGNLU|nr:hypothetical protein ILUMI_01627 [Ignelater luminosus]